MSSSPPSDATHWLYERTPRAWFEAAQTELSRAHGALASGDRKGGLTACRRAAGMAYNARLAARAPLDERFGRSYMDHLRFAATNESGEPDAVRAAAARLVSSVVPGSHGLFVLRTRGEDDELLEATRTLLAHGLAAVLTAEPDEPKEPDEPAPR